MGVLVLAAFGLLGWYIWACAVVALVSLAIRFWWVLAGVGVVMLMAEVAARSP